MNKWYVKIYLSSGSELYGAYLCDLETSQEVAESLFIGKLNAINGVQSMTGGNLFFNISNVIAFEIDIKEII